MRSGWWMSGPLWACATLWGAELVQGAELLALQVETLTVPPSTQPLLFVAVRNQQAETFEGTLAVTGPTGWRIAPASRPLTLRPAESKRVPFTIEQGRNVEENRYAIEVTATQGTARQVQRQETFVATAPYHSVTVDGQAEEWNEAIPVAFSTSGQKTVVSMYWNRRKLGLLVAVQETELRRAPRPDGAGPGDAVQFALWPLEPAHGPASAQAGRFEFLLLPTGTAAHCYQLAAPPTAAEEMARPRPLEPLEAAEVAVRRAGAVTTYECTLPFRLLNDEIRPSEGAEFFFSLVVHDPDGSGLRDLGRAIAGGDEGATPRWGNWPGASWGERPPFCPRLRWGLCASKY